MQLYKFYYKNTNNLLPSYFNSFTPYYNNENHNHDLRYRILRRPMTRQEYYVQCTKYQLLRLIRETPHIDLNRCTQLNIAQFSAYFKYSFINNYNPVCNLTRSSPGYYLFTLWSGGGGGRISPHLNALKYHLKLQLFDMTLYK